MVILRGENKLTAKKVILTASIINDKKPRVFNKLYIGTDQLRAKTVFLEPLNPPLILTDSYPGYFCLYNFPTSIWGIIEVDVDELPEDSLYPFHGYIESLSRRGNQTPKSIASRREKCLANVKNYKTSWKKSLENCGVCICSSRIHPLAISRISTYDPESNSYVTKAFCDVDPWEIKSKDHLQNLESYSILTKWLICENVSGETLASNEALTNRDGLNLYYQRPVSEREKAAIRSNLLRY